MDGNGRRRWQRRQRRSHRNDQNQLNSYHPTDNSASASNSLPAHQQYSDLAGYYWDESRRRYFRIQSDVHSLSTASSYSPSHIASHRKNKERMDLFLSNRRLNKTQVSRAQPNSLNSLINNRQMGRTNGIVTERFTREALLENVRPIPSYSVKVLPDNLDQLAGCQFLYSSKNGKHIVGCWAIRHWYHPMSGGRNGSRIMCLDVKKKRRQSAENRRTQHSANNGEIDSDEESRLEFKATPNCIYALDPSLVDMDIAKVDRDVTCALYVTASSALSRQSQRVTNCCRVIMQPIQELSGEDYGDNLGSPVYNIHYTMGDNLWSCAWNGHKMRIGLGMEDCAMMVDVLSERNYRLSSFDRNVISLDFTEDGDTVYMGLKGAKLTSTDLRQPIGTRGTIGSFDQDSVGWIKVLKSNTNLVAAESFDAQIKLWDIRTRRALRTFEGHCNSHYRLPCMLDQSENLIFAVGSDGTTRCWSTGSGRLLCQIPCPLPVRQKADFPRLCYSQNWAGHSGNGAVILAVEDQLRVHTLSL